MEELKKQILMKQKEMREKRINKFKKKLKKELNFDDQIKEWYLHLKEQLYNRNYKKVINNINSAGLISKFKDCKGGHKIIMLYIKAKLKIIEKKIFKYHISNIENNKQKIQIAHCFSYANNLLNDFKLLTLEISDNTYIYDNNYYNDIDKRNYKIELFDDIINCHFDYIYTMTLLHHKIGNFMEAISYLGLFLTLYKETKPFILSKHTLYKIEKCFILLSRIYISNEDYYNAFIFLNESIKVCFKHILFQVHELYYGVFLGEEKDLEIREKDDKLFLNDSKIKKIIINIVIIFLYQAICNEDLSNIKKATAAYKQCEWFSRVFLSNYNEAFYKLFYQLKKKGIIVCNIIDLFQERIKEKEARLWKKKEKNKNILKNKIFSMKKEKLFNPNKFKGLAQKLQEINIKEIDTVNKFEKNKSIRCLSASRKDGKTRGKYKNLYLSNIRLLEAYLRNDFKNIVSDMKKINIFDLDYKTRVKVQKMMNKIYFDQNQKLIKEKNLSIISKSNIKSRNNIIDEKEQINNNNFKELSRDDYQIFDSFSDYPKKINNKNRKININLSRYKFTKNNSLKSFSQEKGNESNFNRIYKIDRKLYLTNREAFHSPRGHNSESTFLLDSSRYPNQSNKLTNKYKEQKKENQKNKTQYLSKISKYKIIIPENKKLNEFFNHKYQKKRDYIKKLSDRELLFQKSILKSKNTPRFSFDFFNKAESQQNADYSFSKIESVVSNRVNEWKDLSDEEYKEYQLNNRLENALLCSLDNKALSNYKMNLKRKENEEEKKEILEDDSKYYKKFGNIGKNNKNTLNELNTKLNLIYESEFKRKMEMIERDKELNRQIHKKFSRNKSAINSSKIKNIYCKKSATTNFTKIV